MCVRCSPSDRHYETPVGNGFTSGRFSPLVQFLNIRTGEAVSIRKRCKHASGKKGSGKTRVWRQCGCAWGTDIYVDGVRTWKNLGHDEQAARIADAQLRLDVMQGKRVRRAVGAMTKAMRAAGVHIQGKGWHAFRHAHIALLNESGVSLRDSAARLGHGANYAQSLAYGWASEQVDATAVDAAVKRHEKKK